MHAATRVLTCSVEEDVLDRTGAREDPNDEEGALAARPALRPAVYTELSGMGNVAFWIRYVVFLMGYVVIQIGYVVFWIGYVVIRMGYVVIRMGYVVIRMGYVVFWMGYVVFRIGYVHY